MNKKTLTATIVIIVVVLIITIGSAYAYFTANITGAESSSTISVGGGILSLMVNGGNTINVANIIPGPNALITKTITITSTNTTDLTMPYTMHLVIDSNTFTSNIIKYTLNSTNTDNNGEIISSIVTQINIPTGVSTINLGSGEYTKGTNEVHNYVLKLYMPDTGGNQNAEQGKSISAHIEIQTQEADIPAPSGWFTSSTGSLLYALKTNNTLSAPLTVPGNAVSTSIEAVLASTNDDYGTSYYFRGNVTNNYIVFANMCWRIVRVTGDGSIKLALYNYNLESVANPCSTIYEDTTAAYARYSDTNYSSVYNLDGNQNAYIGLIYGTAGSLNYAAEHTNAFKSNILTNLEIWYTNNLSSYSSYLADTIWCNDKSIDTLYPYGTNLGYGTNQTSYSARGRIYANATYETTSSPSLICPNDSNGGKLSKFTVDETLYGNGDLTYKIGLLTIDEIAYAGGRYYKADGSSDNSTFYLYKNATDTWWWTISSSVFNEVSACNWLCTSNGYLSDGGTNVVAAIRPAISLISTVGITGIGTSSNPYVVS